MGDDLANMEDKDTLLNGDAEDLITSYRPLPLPDFTPYLKMEFDATGLQPEAVSNHYVKKMPILDDMEDKHSLSGDNHLDQDVKNVILSQEPQSSGTALLPDCKMEFDAALYNLESSSQQSSTIRHIADDLEDKHSLSNDNHLDQDVENVIFSQEPQSSGAALLPDCKSEFETALYHPETSSQQSLTIRHNTDGHFSPSLPELDLQGTALLVDSQNPSSSGCSMVINSNSQGKGLDSQKTNMNSHLHSRILEKSPRMHAAKKAYKCNVCGKFFPVPSSLIVHQRVHTGYKPFKCEVCNKCFTQSSNLIKHQRVHTGEKPFICDVCDKRFSQSFSFISHQRVHTGEKPFKCNVCDKRCSESGSLIKHQRLHTGDKPFKCDVCDKRFSESSNLISHQRVHTGEKPFRCNVCDKNFSASSSLIVHQRVHTGEYPFKCDVCNKGFSVSGSLIVHQRVHTGDKPFKCDVCGKCFSQSGNLIQHKNKHTN